MEHNLVEHELIPSLLNEKNDSFLVPFVKFLVTIYLLLIFQVPIEWEVVDVTPVRYPDGKFGIPTKAIESFLKNKIGLKGPLATPIGKGHRSLNLEIRK